MEAEKDRVVVRTLAYYATLLSIAWSAGLTGLAAAGNTQVLDRVSGGYFAGEEMPTALRIVYVCFTLLLFGVAWLAWRYHSNTASSRQRRLGRLAVAVSLLSAAVNAISQSPPERYNAIAAAVTALGIAILRRRPLQSRIDLRTRH